MAKIEVDAEAGDEFVIKSLKATYKRCLGDNDPEMIDAIENVLKFYMPYSDAVAWIDKQRHK